MRTKTRMELTTHTSTNTAAGHCRSSSELPSGTAGILPASSREQSPICAQRSLRTWEPSEQTGQDARILMHAFRCTQPTELPVFPLRDKPRSQRAPRVRAIGTHTGPRDCRATLWLRHLRQKTAIGLWCVRARSRMPMAYPRSSAGTGRSRATSSSNHKSCLHRPPPSALSGRNPARYVSTRLKAAL